MHSGTPAPSPWRAWTASIGGLVRAGCIAGAAGRRRASQYGPYKLSAVRGERTISGAAVLAAAASESPAEAGVYLFLGDADEILYVGKATNLRSRLRQHAYFGAPTSHLHQRYELVRRVVWNVTDNEAAAAWREADLIFALRPPFNADPGLRSRDPLGGFARSPFLVVSEGRDGALRFALEPDPSTAKASTDASLILARAWRRSSGSRAVMAM